MSDHESEPVRRLRAVSPDEPVRETAESVLPGLPRVGALDALLREVDGLRLTLETDLSLAASAVEAGSVQMARDIIDGDQQAVRDFEQASLGHLSELSSGPSAPRSAWWRRIPAAPFVAAAAVVGFLVGVAPQLTSHPTAPISTTQASASQSLDQLSRLAASGHTDQVRDAAEILHNQLQALVAQASTDPTAARQGLLLLSAERSIIAQSGDSQALGDVLAASNTLSNLILQAIPAGVRPTPPAIGPTTVPLVVPVTQPTTSPAASSRATSKPSSKPSTKPSPSSSPSASSTSSPSAGAPGPGTGVLPTNPSFGQ